MEDSFDILRRHDLIDEPGLTVIQRGRQMGKTSASEEHRRLAIDEFTKRERFETDGFVVTDWPSYFTIDWDEKLPARTVSYAVGAPEVQLDDLLEGLIDPLS